MQELHYLQHRKHKLFSGSEESRSSGGNGTHWEYLISSSGEETLATDQEIGEFKKFEWAGRGGSRL